LTPVLDLDIKEWFKDPITHRYMSILAAMGNESKEALVSFLDMNQDIDAHDMKNIIKSNCANRELIEKITDVRYVIEEFKEFNLLIEEVAEDANKH
jgi:hypothetical protein